MGTDIYMYVEHRVESRWQLCGPLTTDSQLSFPEPLPEGYLVPQCVYDTRNYSLFAILGGVRNPHHSAVPYTPIAAPRGLPSDMSGELTSWTAMFPSMEDASWLLLREIEEFPWHERQITKEAIVAPSVAPLFAGGKGRFPLKQWPEGEPVSYSLYKRDGVTVTWVESYAESAGDEFLVETMTRLRQCGAPDDVRIVFWFGS